MPAPCATEGCANAAETICYWCATYLCQPCAKEHETGVTHEKREHEEL